MEHCKANSNAFSPYINSISTMLYNGKMGRF